MREWLSKALAGAGQELPVQLTGARRVRVVTLIRVNTADTNNEALQAKRQGDAENRIHRPPRIEQHAFEYERIHRTLALET